MMENSKIVRDPIHGDIKLSDIFVDLLETPELQRLYNIKQLGFADLVFPGAHHTRLEHCLGVFWIASQIGDALELDAGDCDLIKCAGILHDIGHGPFSHTLEAILLEKFGVDHVDLTEKLILGEYSIFDSEESTFIESENVCGVLDALGVDKKRVVDIIRGKVSEKPFLSQILNSSIDADQLDYLIRDAYYTGVAFGMIDVERFVQMLSVFDGNLVVKRKGVSSIENILMARALMYSSVYFHKTVRIAELMLSKAIEQLVDPEPFEFFRMTDSEIISALKSKGGFQHEIITRLKYRRLFKQAYSVSLADLEDKSILGKLENSGFRKGLEHEMEEAFGIPRGHVIIDVPRFELMRAEPRINKTDIGVEDLGEVRSLDDFTPVAGAVRSRVAPDWALMVVTDERYRDVVFRKAEKLLFA